MSQQDPNGSEELPEATLKTHHRSHGASPIWLIPLIAAVIGPLAAAAGGAALRLCLGSAR